MFFIELKELNRSSNFNFLNAEKFLKCKMISLIWKNRLFSQFPSSFFVSKHFRTSLNQLSPSPPFPSIKGIQKGTNLNLIIQSILIKKHWSSFQNISFPPNSHILTYISYKSMIISHWPAVLQVACSQLGIRRASRFPRCWACPCVHPPFWQGPPFCLDLVSANLDWWWRSVHALRAHIWTK